MCSILKSIPLIHPPSALYFLISHRWPPAVSHLPSFLVLSLIHMSCPVIDLTSDDECTLVDVMKPFIHFRDFLHWVIFHNRRLDGYSIRLDVKGNDPLSYFSGKEKICKSGNIDIYIYFFCRVPSHDFDDLKKKIHGAAITCSKVAVAVANSKLKFVLLLR